jgi:outer membrane protein OmpA-like peptidoglycan-associated protein
MNQTIHKMKNFAGLAAVAVLAGACMSAPVKPDGADAARAKLTQLQANQELAGRAPVAIKEAEVAVALAEVPREDREMATHLVVLADRKVDIAAAQAQSRLLEDQRKTLTEQRERARLDSRTKEADIARIDANSARVDADIAREQANAATLQADDLKRQIAELNAKETERGLVVTLGDVLFETGRSDLKGGAVGSAAKLAAFLTQYPDRTVVIEGHTDDVGSAESNQGLSQRRANAVKAYLVAQGVSAARLQASGMGESAPVSGNDSSTGRQQNRRVEVIIANAVAMKQ